MMICYALFVLVCFALFFHEARRTEDITLGYLLILIGLSIIPFVNMYLFLATCHDFVSRKEIFKIVLFQKRGE